MESGATRALCEQDLRVVLVGTYPPRRCGIATFTYDLALSLAGIVGKQRCRVVALTNTSEWYDYPEEVSFEIQQNRLQDYQIAAEYINFSNANLVCLQHEFGIFGGAQGAYLFSLLDNLKKPLVTTLHTVIRNPESEYHAAMEKVLRRSDTLVVMSQTGAGILQDEYGVAPERIAVIHHGVPDVPFTDSNLHKDQFGLAGRLVILSFGLVGPNKGIEVMLEALTAVVQRHPNVTYVILGATHPEIKRSQGERYRISLERKVRDLGLQPNVVFLNTFVDTAELIDYICASDIYVTPYLSEEQIVSGTLAYAVGAGKAVISTPYLYAREILDDNRGILVPFNDVSEMSNALLSLIERPAQLHRMRSKAYEFGRQMIWAEVGRRYAELFCQVVSMRGAVAAQGRGEHRISLPVTLPDIKLDHLRLLSDDVGIMQHAPYGVPDRSFGYTTDDVARALVAVLHLQHIGTDGLDRLGNMYLSFLRRAQTTDGHFRNLVSYDHKFLDEKGGEDTLGMVIWGLGETIRFGVSEGMRAFAQNMIEKTEGFLYDLSAPRAKAYAICGLHAILRCYGGASWCRRLLRKLADDLMAQYEDNRAADWEWFEPVLTYGNAKLSEAMILAHEATGDPAFLQVGLSTLDFLTQCQFNGQFFDLVGNNGWLPRGGIKAPFGQQPIDASYLVQAYVAAHRVTRLQRYLDLAQLAFEWFLGRNRFGEPLYDFRTGACADGLDPQGVSQNQGAESTICYLLGLSAILQARMQGTETHFLTADRCEWGVSNALEKTDRHDFQLPAPALRHRNFLRRGAGVHPEARSRAASAGNQPYRRGGRRRVPVDRHRPTRLVASRRREGERA